MKKLYFGSNLKMYKGKEETEKYLRDLVERVSEIDRNETELFIIPSFTSLENALKICESTNIRIGAQNMCWAEEGQFTGEISPRMLEELGIDLVMIGHSERRHVFGETNQEENKKVVAALMHDLKTLLCIGETEEEKNFGISEEIVRIQLKTGLFNVKESQIKNLWIAYEPVWSIGVNGTPASAEYAEKIHSVIKNTLKEMFGEKGEEIPILYGGSVNFDNAEALIKQPSIDGLFVGRAAWKAENFEKLLIKTTEIYQIYTKINKK